MDISPNGSPFHLSVPNILANKHLNAGSFLERLLVWGGRVVTQGSHSSQGKGHVGPRRVEPWASSPVLHRGHLPLQTATPWLVHVQTVQLALVLGLWNRPLSFSTAFQSPHQCLHLVSTESPTSTVAPQPSQKSLPGTEGQAKHFFQNPGF